MVPNSDFQEPVSLDAARRQLLNWNRDLCTSEGIQTAFIAVWNNTNFTPHWHALIFGKNQNGRTLLDVLRKDGKENGPGLLVLRLSEAIRPLVIM